MSSSAPFSLDLLSSSPSEKLCYVHCSSCDTVLAVSVPYSSLFKTVTVRCGHCANLLSVNMRALLLPSINSQLHHLSHPFLSPELEEQSFAQPNLMPDNSMPPVTKGEQEEAPQNPVINRPPEKRQRVPSAYNRFIKDEIQRIKAANPDISHREAFSAAAKNWAHFPHIQFGLMPDEALKNTSVHPPGLEDGFLYGGQLSSFALLGAENCMS